MKRLASRAALVALVLSAFVSSLPAQYSLPTPIDFNNAQSGIMFNLRANTRPVRVTAIDVVAEPGTHTFEIWRTIGLTYINHETDPSAWVLLGSNTITVPPGYGLTPLGIPLDIQFEAFQIGGHGIYITSTAPSSSTIKYTNGSNRFGLRAQDQHIEITEGVGKSYPFGATYPSISTTDSRMFNGRIHYSLTSQGDLDALYAGSPTISGTGLVFDMVASEYLTVEGFDLFLDAGVHTLEVWTTRDGGPSGPVASTPGAWVLAGTVVGFNAPVSSFDHDLGFDLDVPMVPGQPRGFCVTRTSAGPPGIGFRDSGAALGSTSTSNLFLETKVGEVRDYFLGATGTTAGICGVVHVHRNLPGATTNNNSTLLATGNGPNVGPGLFFDLAATSDEFVRVASFSAYMYAGTHDVELWLTKDRTSHIGKETNPALWHRVAATTITVSSNDTLTYLFKTYIVLEPGAVQGCYLTTTSGSSLDISYSFAPTGVPYASTPWFEIRGGRRANYPFGGNVFQGRGPDLEIQAYVAAAAHNTIVEDFGEGYMSDPPSGWFTHLAEGDVHTTAADNRDGWVFTWSWSVGIPPNPPIQNPYAAVNSDYSGMNNPIDCYLYSPPFDASTGLMSLSFDHYFRQYSSSVATVEIWDGTGWNNVYVTTATTANPEEPTLDITAAAGGFTKSRCRFRYVGNYDWYWFVDNVSITGVGVGQAPRPGLGVFDLNYAREQNGMGVGSNLPGPYFAEGNTAVPAVFQFEGETFQPIYLFQGLANPNGWDFLTVGKLDIGVFDPTSGTFSFIEQLASGAEPGFINSLFVTSATGWCQLAFPLPPFTIGNTYNFQAMILSSHINAALTNMVSLEVLN